MFGKIKNYFKRFSLFFWKFLRRADIIVVFFALALMHNLHWIVEMFYPVTGEPSMIWLYTTIFGLTRASMVIGYSYLMFRIFFPKAYRYLEDAFNNDFNKLKWEKRLYLTLFLYAFFIVVFLVSVVTM